MSGRRYGGTLLIEDGLWVVIPQRTWPDQSFSCSSISKRNVSPNAKGRWLNTTAFAKLLTLVADVFDGDNRTWVPCLSWNRIIFTNNFGYLLLTFQHHTLKRVFRTVPIAIKHHYNSIKLWQVVSTMRIVQCFARTLSAAARFRAPSSCKSGHSKMARSLLGLRKLAFRPSFFRLSALRPIHTGTMSLGNLEEEFNSASERTKTLKQDPGNDHKLKLYALFKQVNYSTDYTA